MQNEDKTVLKKVAELLLDEKVKAMVETTYLRDNQRKDDIEFTAQPGIPTRLGRKKFGWGVSANVHRARSIKIGKYSMRKFGERGFRIITPEGKDYFFEGSLLHRQTAATYVWAAALAKCDNNQKEANLLLKKLNLENLTTTKSKSRYESAKERVLSKSKKIYIQKNNDIER